MKQATLKNNQIEMFKTAVFWLVICFTILWMNESKSDTWKQGFGQGVTEYNIQNATGDTFTIACDGNAESGEGVSVYATSKSIQYGAGNKKTFKLFVDNKEHDSMQQVDTDAGASLFWESWNTIRKAKELQIKTSDGKVIVFTFTNAGSILPAKGSKTSTCNTY